MARLNWTMARLEHLLKETTEGLGYHFWGLEYLTVSGVDTLRLYIEGGAEGDKNVTPDDCEQVSKQIGALMEINSPISGRYSLEVSSPGLDRRLFCLEQCRQAVGQRLRLKVRSVGRRNLIGLLLAVGEDSLQMQPEGGKPAKGKVEGEGEAVQQEYSWSDLERVQVAPEWKTVIKRRR